MLCNEGKVISAQYGHIWIVQQAPSIKSADYLQKHLYMFIFKHVMDVLEVFQELFEDTNDYDEQMEELALIHNEVSQAEDYLLESEMIDDLSAVTLAHLEDSWEDYSRLQEFEQSF